MVRIDWVQICETAFFDDSDRLCMIGVMMRFPAPKLPIAMRQVMIVVRICDAEPGESLGIGVSMVTPAGMTLTPQNTDGFEVAVAPDYILITLRDIPLREEGVHRFCVSLGKGNPVFIDIPVRAVAKSERPDRNAHDRNSSALRQSSGASGR